MVFNFIKKLKTQLELLNFFVFFIILFLFIIFAIKFLFVIIEIQISNGNFTNKYLKFPPLQQKHRT